MTDTERARIILRTLNSEFTVSDISVCKKPASILNKLEQAGEIAQIGTRKRYSNRLMKVYVSLCLKPAPAPKQEKHTRVRQVRADTPFIAAWRKVYPEFFREPDLRGTLRMVTLEADLRG